MPMPRMKTVVSIISSGWAACGINVMFATKSSPRTAKHLSWSQSGVSKRNFIIFLINNFNLLWKSFQNLKLPIRSTSVTPKQCRQKVWGWFADANMKIVTKMRNLNICLTSSAKIKLKKSKIRSKRFSLQKKKVSSYLINLKIGIFNKFNSISNELNEIFNYQKFY